MKKIILILSFIFIYSFAECQGTNSHIESLLSNQGKVLYGDEPNSIMVIDYPENIQRISEYLETMDVAPEQVLIEARVVEVKLQKEHALGINWNAFTDKGYMPLGRFKAGSSALGIQPGRLAQTIGYKTTYYPPGQTSVGAESPFTFAIFDDNINIVLQTLATALDTNILSAPRVTTVNNREAEIKIIQRLPWAEPQIDVSGTSAAVTVTWDVNFEEVGIILKVTPTINEDGKISMVLSPEVSEKTGDYSLTVVQGTTSVPYTVPIIDKRSASTKVVIGNGQTLIIGGLIKDKITKGESKIPLLGDIPYLGYLFKSKKDTRDKTELLIFVSPTIITPEEFVRMARQETRYRSNNVDTKDEERQAQISLLMKALEKEKARIIDNTLEKEETLRILEDAQKKN